MKPEASDADQLAEFKKFIYQSYAKTQPIFGDAAASEISGRSAPLEPLPRKGLPPDRKARILDYGCGDGVLLSTAEKLGYRDLFGVDLSQGLIDRAARITSAKLLCGDGLEYLNSCPDGAFEH